MKKIILIAIALIGLQGIAQEQGREGRKHQKGDHSKMDLTAEQMATLQTKRMTLALDLNASQQTDIQALNLEKATKRKAMKAERQANKDKEAPKKLTSEERYNKQIAMLDARIAEKAKLQKILNKEQFEKFEKMMKHKQRAGKKGKHGDRKGKYQNG
ncbi:Spy/CpxP family protein refolding chaperone [Pseudotamlana agarivorans]|uniref:Spy/CpxP family protein refolding chaperone n=1 Tax=Pseudotamlana agarivorans TaxID=481183 RepID=UPI00082DAF8A|nr:Spy/CpxP family protein refolding chaperone [Tamlana agarivorans]